MRSHRPLTRAAAFLVVACFGLLPAAAQTPRRQPAPQPSPTPENSAEVDPATADVSITASVKARELRFDAVPNPQVVFTGHPERNTQWKSFRQNLPNPVEPGVTYRDFGIQVKIVSVFADIDRIVAEALGEIPTTDTPGDAPPPDQASAQAARTNHPSQTSAPRKNRRSASRRKPR